MVNKEYKEFLINAYNVGNVHLCEQSKKRDQVITFYIALLSFLTAFYETITTKFDESIACFVFVIVFFLGFICLIQLIYLRVWHIHYLKCCITISKIMVSDKLINNYDELVNFIRKNNLIKDKKINMKEFFASSENIVILGFSFINLIPVYMLFFYMLKYFNYNVIFISIIYILTTYFFLCYSIKRAYKHNTWILNFENIIN